MEHADFLTDTPPNDYRWRPVADEPSITLAQSDLAKLIAAYAVLAAIAGGVLGFVTGFSARGAVEQTIAEAHS